MRQLTWVFQNQRVVVPPQPKPVVEAKPMVAPLPKPKPIPVAAPPQKPKIVLNPDKPYSQGWERATLIRDANGKGIGFTWAAITDEEAMHQ